MRDSGVFVALAVCMCAMAGVAAADEPPMLESLVAALEPATLVVYGTLDESGAPVQGTGVSVGGGLVLTTAHQVADAVNLNGANDDFRCRLEIVATDADKDLALLRADPPPPAAVTLGDASNLAKGASVFVLSAPAGMRLTLTTGTIATTGITLNEQPRVQVDMALAAGSSGGPAFDREGLLIGIVSARADGLEGFTIVTPVNEAYGLLRQHGISVPGEAGEAFEQLEPSDGEDEALRAAISAYNRGVESAATAEKIRHYEAAIEYAGDFFEAWFNLGVAHAARGDKDAAVAAYRAAHLLRPDSVRTQRNYGQALLSAGDAPGALRVLREVASREPGDPRVLNDIGEAHRRMGHFDEAARKFDQALSLDDTHAPTHFNLALVLVQMERRDEAIQSFERYLALRPGAEDATEIREAIDRLRKGLP